MQVPIPTSATRGQTPEVREATTLITCKKVTTPKFYKNEKTENSNSDKGERKKKSENQLSREEILSLQEKDFRLLMVKMMQNIGNKLEAKMDNLQKTLSKEIQGIKLKQEMQNTVAEIKKKIP